MIRIRRPSVKRTLDSKVLATLEQKRNDLASVPAGVERIAARWKRFCQSKSGKAVRRHLRRIFIRNVPIAKKHGASTVDHYRPKTKYPSQVFWWNNFLLCCDNCNRYKAEKFAIVNRKPLLLNPCRDDPLDFFTWDPQTGIISFTTDRNRIARTQYTHDLLHLDDDDLPRDGQKC